MVADSTFSPAQDLERAFSRLDPRNEDFSAETLEALYEPRSDPRSLKELLSVLRISVKGRRFLHALYMGPSGCGKSTDLAWLTDAAADGELADELFIVHFGVGDVVGTHKVGFADLAIALVLQLYDEFERLGLPALDIEYLEKIESWFFESAEVKETRKQTLEGGIAARLKLFKLGFSGTRIREQTVVAALQHRVPELRGLVDGLLAAVHERTGKTVLFVVDDLEKINPLDSALGLFLNQAAFFSDLACHMVLTAPGALRLDPRFHPDVLKHFLEFRAVLGDPTETRERERLARLVHRRLDPGVLAPGALETAISKTGGVVGHLVTVLQKAVLSAITADQQTVRREDVERALSDMQQLWLHSLREQDYVELGRVRLGGADSHLEAPGLLHSLAVLEYPDSPIRYGIHPLVAPLLQRWQRANLARGDSSSG